MGSLSRPIEGITRPIGEAAAKAVGPNVVAEVMTFGFRVVLFDVPERRIAATLVFESAECRCGWRYLPGRFRECVRCAAPLPD